MKIIFTELLLFGRMNISDEKEIPRSSDSLSRKTQRLLNHEKGDPGNSAENVNI